jgi:tetratricopeptide (TPR) repeat protein
MLLLGVGGVAATFLLVATGALAFYVYSESISLDQQRRQLALEQAQPIAPPPAVLPSAPAEPLVVAKAEPASVVIPQDLALRPLAVEALPDRVDAAPLDNSPAAVMKRKGNELVAAGDFSGARNFYRSAVEANPYYFEGYNNLGNTYTDTGAHGVAEPVYQRGLSLAPESDTLRFNLGNSYFRAGRYNEAIPHLERLIYYKPEDKEARLILGCCYYHLQRFNDAAQQFSVVLKEQSNHPEANFNMGLTLRALGQADLASAYLREAQRVREEAQQ